MWTPTDELYKRFAEGDRVVHKVESGSKPVGVVLACDDPRYLDKYGVPESSLPVMEESGNINGWRENGLTCWLEKSQPLSELRCAECNTLIEGMDYLCLTCRNAQSDPACVDCHGEGEWHECGRTQTCGCLLDSAAR